MKDLMREDSELGVNGWIQENMEHHTNMMGVFPHCSADYAFHQGWVDAIVSLRLILKMQEVKAK